MEIVELFEMSDTIGVWPTICRLQERLSLADTIHISLFSASLTDNFVMADEIVCKAPIYLTITENLTLGDSIIRDRIDLTVTDTFVWIDVLDRPLHFNVVESFTFTDEIAQVTGQSVYEQWTPTDTIGLSKSINLTVTDALALADRVNFLTYRQPLSPVVVTSGVTFVGANGTLAMPNPDFGDVLTLALQRSQKVAMGGQQLIANVQRQPKHQFRFEWTYLYESQVAKLRQFVRSHLGLPVTMVDHFGITRTLIIVNNPEYAAIGRDNYSAGLDTYQLAESV